MPPDERTRVVLAKLQAQVRYAWERSPFYRRLWSEAGVGPDALVALGDLARFPLVTKEQIRADQEAFPPFGSNVCCSPEAIT